VLALGHSPGVLKVDRNFIVLATWVNARGFENQLECKGAHKQDKAGEPEKSPELSSLNFLFFKLYKLVIIMLHALMYLCQR